MHKWGNQGTERLSSPLPSPDVPSTTTTTTTSTTGKKRLTNTSIKPRLSKQKPSTAALLGNPLQGLSPPWAMVTTPGASFKPHSSSTSTGRVPEPLHPDSGRAMAPSQLCSGPALFQGRRFMYYMWLYFLEHLCFSLSKPGSCLDDLRGEYKPELLIYLKAIKLCLMQTACLLLPPSISRMFVCRVEVGVGRGCLLLPTLPFPRVPLGWRESSQTLH